MIDHNVALDFFKRAGNSKLQEQFAEYFFLKDIILQAACKEERLDIARSDFDAFGFDLFISRRSASSSKTINVQLKATSGKCTRWDVHKSLLEIENGRIILVHLPLAKLSDGPTALITPRYLLFDSAFNKEALETKPKVAKDHKCMVKLGQFRDISENLLQLFE
jgi:hypothetical protein